MPIYSMWSFSFRIPNNKPYTHFSTPLLHMHHIPPPYHYFWSSAWVFTGNGITPGKCNCNDKLCSVYLFLVYFGDRISQSL